MTIGAMEVNIYLLFIFIDLLNTILDLPAVNILLTQVRSTISFLSCSLWKTIFSLKIIVFDIRINCEKLITELIIFLKNNLVVIKTQDIAEIIFQGIRNKNCLYSQVRSTWSKKSDPNLSSMNLHFKNLTFL